MENCIKILMLEHDTNDLELLQYALKKSDLHFVSEVAETRETFEKALVNFQPDLILSDFSLPSFDGFTAFRIKENQCPDIPFIIVSGTIGDENAVELIKSGVTDYVLKEKLYQLGPKITRALKEAEDRKQKKQAEENLIRKKKQLKEAYKQSKNILESISEGFFSIDKNWIVTYWNKEAERMLLTPKENILGKNLWDVFAEAVTSTSYTEYHRVMAEQITVDFQEYYPQVERWFEITASPSKDGLTALFKDVTDIKLAEEKLKSNERRFRALFQNSSDGLTLLAADGTVIERSPAAQKLLGLDRKEVSGEFRTDFVHPDDLHIIEQACADAIKYPDYINTVEFRLLDPDGAVRWLEVTLQNELNEPAVNAVVINFRDITKRKQSELALIKNEQIFNKAQKIAHVGSWHVETNTGKVFWSDETFRILGLIPGEAQPSLEYYLSFVHPDDLPFVKNALETMENNHVEVAFNLRIIRKDGALRYLLSDSKFEVNPKTKEVLLFGVLQDITDQKLAEEKLRLSEARLNAAQVIGKIGNWEINFLDGTSEWSNEMFNMFGLEKANVIPSLELFQSLIHPDDLDPLNEKFNATLAQFTNGSDTYRYFRPNGELRYAYAEWRFKKDQKGMPVSVFGIQQDITDQKLIELALEQSKEKYQSLFDLSPIPMWVFDVDTLNFLNVNEAAIRHYGYTKDEFLNMTLKDIRPANEIGKLQQTVEMINETGAYFQGVFQHIKKSGEIIQVEIKSNQIYYEGRNGRLILALDISERLKYVQAIEDQNNKLREIAWIQSHVVRAPLARMMGLVSLLQDYAYKEKQIAELVNHLMVSSLELDKVIRDIIKETDNIEARV